MDYGDKPAAAKRSLLTPPRWSLFAPPLTAGARRSTLLVVMFHAAALAQLGREDEAKKMIADFRRQASANASLPYAYYLRGFKHDEDREHYTEALRKAGLEGDIG